jgi:hypothetical protein
MSNVILMKYANLTSDDVEFVMEAKFLLGGAGGSPFSFIF